MAVVRGARGKFARSEKNADVMGQSEDFGRFELDRKENGKGGWIEKMAPVLMVLVIVMSFALGSLWSKVKYLETAVKDAGTKTNTETTAAADQQQAAPAVKADLNTIKGLFDMNLIKFGDAGRKLLFVEFGDPSCPFCHVAAGKNPELNRQMDSKTNRFQLVSDGGLYLAPVPEMKKLVDSGKASLVMIYTPGHGNGEMGMKAMYCAYEAGRFWQVHDTLYTMKGYEMLNNTVKNDKANSGVLADFLKGAMDAKKMKDCLDSGKYDSRIDEDVMLAEKTGAEGTPGFYINDKFFNGAYSYNDMKSVADAALK